MAKSNKSKARLSNVKGRKRNVMGGLSIYRDLKDKEDEEMLYFEDKMLNFLLRDAVLQDTDIVKKTLERSLKQWFFNPVKGRYEELMPNFTKEAMQKEIKSACYEKGILEWVLFDSKSDVLLAAVDVELSKELPDANANLDASVMFTFNTNLREDRKEFIKMYIAKFLKEYKFAEDKIYELVYNKNKTFEPVLLLA